MKKLLFIPRSFLRLPKLYVKACSVVGLLPILLLFSSTLHAQDNKYPVLAMKVETQAISNYLTPDSIIDYSDSTVFSSVMNISLFDTSNIKSIHVKLGTTNGGGDLLDKIFSFDVTGNFSDGTSYLRDGYNITLNLGNHMTMQRYFSEIKIEKGDGTFTDIVAFAR